MHPDLIPMVLCKIMQARTYTAMILQAGAKRFPIYADVQVGNIIQLHLLKHSQPRPYTHDLLSSVLSGFDVQVLQIVIQDLQDTTYFARLFLQQQYEDKKKIVEIDARPSDCVTLAVIHGTPMFCRKAVLDKVISIEDGVL